jgi:hypothetical protein
MCEQPHNENSDLAKPSQTRFAVVALPARRQSSTTNDRSSELPGYADPETDVQMMMTIAPLKTFIVPYCLSISNLGLLCNVRPASIDPQHDPDACPLRPIGRSFLTVAICPGSRARTNAT